MVKVGDVVMKLAGRDAGRIGVVTEDLGKGYFMIDGDTRKRKTNYKHLEFLGKEVKLGKNFSSEEINDLFNAIFLTAGENLQTLIMQADDANRTALQIAVKIIVLIL